MPVTREMLQSDPAIGEKLWPFDFVLRDNQSFGPVWFETEPLAPFNIVARRNSGGVFALVGPEQHLLLATSEGQASIIAASLHEALELIVAHPYWCDIVKPAKGELANMQLILRDEFYDLEASIDEEIEEFRPWLRERLGLAEPTDAVERLHHAMTSLTAQYVLRDNYGNMMQGLYANRL